MFQHPSVEHLRGELDRNGQLRHMCGLDSVSSSSAYSRLLSNLLKPPEDVDAIFHKLVNEIKEVLPDFGKMQNRCYSVQNMIYLNSIAGIGTYSRYCLSEHRGYCPVDKE